MKAYYRTLSYGFGIRTELPHIAEALELLLAPFRVSGEIEGPTYGVIRGNSTRRRFVVHLDGRVLQANADARPVVEYIVWHANTEAIKRTRDHLAFHAAAVSLNGSGVILPAPPDSGKTTLTAGLVRAGFDYLSDEAALIDPASAWLHPFPRALWMQTPTVELLGRSGDGVPDLEEGRFHYQVPPHDLRSGSIGNACPVRFIVAPRYEAGTATEATSMTRAETVRMLAQNSFNFPRFGARGLDVLHRLVAGARCFRLRVGDLESAVAAVSDLAGRGSGSARAHPADVDGLRPVPDDAVAERL